MKIVNVTYTAKPEFVEQNKRNIQAVMAKLREMNSGALDYTCCLGPDGKTFNHRALFASEADEKILLTLPEFLHFQTELKASGPEVPPKQELLELVGSSRGQG